MGGTPFGRPDDAVERLWRVLLSHCGFACNSCGGRVDRAHMGIRSLVEGSTYVNATRHRLGFLVFRGARVAGSILAGLPMMRVGMSTFLAFLALSALPEALWACPVCFDSSDENRQAFLATTIFLSILPLGMVAGAGIYIRKRVRGSRKNPANTK
jgi:hypothetical protein